jgi:WD40 repeat protein
MSKIVDENPYPYRGLAPYSEKDALFFFGREEKENIIIDNLKTSPLTLLYGESGVGKSSLLRAGVAHQLHREADENRERFKDMPKLAVVIFDEWTKLDTLKNLEESIHISVRNALKIPNSELEINVDKKFQQRKKLAEDGKFKQAPEFIQKLQVYAELTSGEYGDGKLFIILDQFEEYFVNQSRIDKNREFEKAFCRAVKSSSGDFNFLISIRSDALFRLNQFSGQIPGIQNNYIELKQLEQKCARDAIEKPIEEYNRQQIIIENLQCSRLTIVYGDSNAGKSLVLRKGIDYRLRQETKQKLADNEGVISGSKTDKPSFFVIFFDALEECQKNDKLSLIDILKQKIKEEIQNYGVLKQELFEPSGLSCTLKQTLQVYSEAIGRLLIILDQFEKCEKEDGFITELSETINCSDLPVNFLVSYQAKDRSAIDSNLSHFKNLIYKWPKTYLRIEKQMEKMKYSYSLKLDPLEEGSAQISIKKPLKYSIDGNLINYILKDIPASMKKPGTLVEDSSIGTIYLQLVMVHLWQKETDQKSHILRLETYHKDLGGAAKIVQNHVDSQMKDLESDRHREAASHVFHYLVTPSYARQSLSSDDLKKYIHDDLKGHGLTFQEKQKQDIEHVLEILSSKNSCILKRVQIPSLGSSSNVEFRYEIYHDGLARAILKWGSYYLKGLQNLAIKRGIAAQALYHQRLRHDEVAALLARQAYYFNRPDKNDLQILEQVDEALRTSLGVEDFSNVLEGHQGGIRAVAFSSPDGQKLASAGHDSTVRLWDLCRQSNMKPKLLGRNLPIGFWILLPIDLLAVILFLCVHTETVSSLAYSSHEEMLASGSWDGTVRLWDRQGNLVKCWFHTLEESEEKQSNDVQAVAFHPTKKMLASGGNDGIIRLWDLNQPNFLENPPSLDGHHRKPVRSIAFSANGEMLASGGEDGTVVLWKDINNTNEKITLGQHYKDGELTKVNSVAFSPDGKMIVSGGNDWKVRQWSTLSQNEILPELGKHEDKVNAVAFSPDGQWIASGGEDQKVLLWNFKHPERKPESLTGHHSGISSIEFSPHDKKLKLATGSWDFTIRLWDLYYSEAKPKLPYKHEENVMSVAFSPDGHWLASGSWDKTVVLAFSPDGHWHSKCSRKILSGHKDEVYTVAFFFDKDKRVQLLASGSKDKTILLWDLKNIEQNGEAPQVIKKLVGHTDGVSSLAFSPDGYWLLSGSWKEDATVRLWDLRQSGDTINNGKILWKHGSEEEAQSVTSVAFSSNGRILASGSDDTTIKLLDMRKDSSTLKEIYANLPEADVALENKIFVEPNIELKGHTDRVWSIAFQPASPSSNRTILASGSDDRTVRLWNLDQINPNENPIILEGYGYWVGSVAFSPDGKTLASGCYDKTIRIWDLEKIDWEQRQLKVRPIILRGHDQAVTSVAFTPDGNYLASGSYDNTVLLWIARTEILADMVCDKVLRNLTLTEWKQFFGEDIPYMRTCPNLPPDKNAPPSSETVPFYTK